MLSEEKKAIDNLFHLQHINTYLDLSKESFQIDNKTIIKWKESVDIVLNLITKLQKENEDLKTRKDNQEKRFRRYKEDIDKQHEEIYENLVCENEEKDKQIDLMSEFISNHHCFELMVYSLDGECKHEYECKECIKQYFEKLAKEKGKR